MRFLSLSRDSVKLEFDAGEATLLASAFRGDGGPCEATVDSRLLGGRAARSGKELTLPFRVVQSVDEKMLLVDRGGITLWISPGLAEAISERFEASVPDGFSPAEIGEFYLARSRGWVDLFAELT